MKKILSLVLVFTLLLSLSACAARETAQTPEKTEAPEPKEGSVGLANPVHEMTPEEILTRYGIDLAYLAEYENAAFSVIDGDPVVMQARFLKDGCEYTYRVATPPQETDISGMYYEWSEQSNAPVGRCEALVRLAKDGAGVISWYDLVPGVMYSLATAGKTDAAALTALAGELFVPTQGEVDGMEPTETEAQTEPLTETPAAETDEAFRALFTAALTELQSSYFPGTAGSSLVAAKNAAALADLFSELAPAKESVAACVTAFIEDGSVFTDTLPESAFAEQVFGVFSAYGDMVRDGVDILESAGAAAAHYPWGNDVHECFAALRTAGSAAAYADVLSNYATALREGWDGQKLAENSMNVVLRDQNAENTGYRIEDLDGDGICELLLGTIASDDYLGHMILELYTVNEFGRAAQVFCGGERNRYYYAGGDLFGHEGSSGASDSFAATEQYCAGAMVELGYDVKELVQAELTRFLNARF